MYRSRVLPPSGRLPELARYSVTQEAVRTLPARDHDLDGIEPCGTHAPLHHRLYAPIYSPDIIACRTPSGAAAL